MFNEQILEKLTMDLLYELGYNYMNQDEVRANRTSQIILEKDLRQAIKRININIKDKEIQEVIKTIENGKEKSTIGKNKEFTRYLQEGVSISNYQKIKIIDFENIENNTFRISNESSFLENKVAQIDMVIYINGLPLVVIELKRGNDGLKRGYYQLKSYQEVSDPSLFYYNQFMIVTNGEQAKVGTITNAWENFREWKQVEENETENLKTHDTLFRGMLRKDRILDIIRNFIIWKNEEKILAAYHQYFAVKKVLKSTQIAVEQKNKKAGIIYHAPGSGKTIFSIFYSRNLLKNYTNAKILIITDRVELKNQLFYMFSGCQELSNQNLQIINSQTDMKKLEWNGIFFMTIQQIMIQKNVLSTSEKIFIIVDDIRGMLGNNNNETTNGVEKIQEIFPNSTYLAITSIPQTIARNNIFGDIIDRYDMSQAVQDQLTVPIVYEERKLDLRFIGQKYDDVKTQMVMENSARIGQMVKDIIYHYEIIQNATANKAMIVTNSIQSASEIYHRLLILKPEWSKKVQLVTSTIKHTNYEKLEKEFRDMESEFKIAIVVNMWLTGMDIPGLGVMYINRPMQKEILMQAIARVNRPYKGKTAGLIVDYIGLKKELQEAIKLYTVKDRMEIVEDKKLKERLIEKLESIKKLYLEFCPSNITELLKYDTIKAGAEIILKNATKTNKFMEDSQEIKNIYLSCARILDEKNKQESIFFIAIRAFVLRIMGKEFELNEMDREEASLLEKEIKIDEDSKISEIRNMPQRNIATLLLKKKIKKWIEKIGDDNIALRKKFLYELDKVEIKYKERKTLKDVENIINDLEKMIKTIEEEANKTNQYHLSVQEKAIWDILGQDLKEKSGEINFIELAKKIVEVANSYMVEDWNRKKETKARIRIELKKVLLRNNYSLVEIEEVIQLIMRQLEEWDKNKIEKQNE